MIAYLHGKLTEKAPTHVIIECNGVGYRVKISLYTYGKIGDVKELKLFTYLQIKEDAHTLYGFFDQREQSIFEQLISISGVGGNTAVMILSSITPTELFHAIRTENANTLKQVKGIGAKTAARIILELKDKIKIEGSSVEDTPIKKDSHKKEEALQALVSLGLPKGMMEKRVNQILKESPQDLSIEDIVKLALRNR